MSEHSLELANRVEVLRRTSVATDSGGEVRHHRCRQIRKLACVSDPNLGGDLEPNDSRHRSVDSSPLGDPGVPGVPLESLIT